MDPNAKILGDKTPIFVAVSKNNIKALKLLIEYGANVNMKDSMHNNTVLHNAAFYGYLNAVKVLISNGALINDIDNTESTPLFSAVAGGNPEIVQSLINNGTNINHKNKYEQSALIYAIYLNKIKCAEVLLKNGAETNIVDETGWSPLLLSVEEQKGLMTKLLLKYKSNVNNTAPNSLFSPLIIAVKNKDLKIIEILLTNSNLKVNQRDFLGRTALDIAINYNNNPDIVTLLKAHGAKTAKELETKK